MRTNRNKHALVYERRLKSKRRRQYGKQVIKQELNFEIQEEGLSEELWLVLLY